MAKSKKKKTEDEHRSEEEELEDEDELEEDEYDEDELEEDEYDEDELEEDEYDEDELEEEEGEEIGEAFGAAEEPEDPFWWTPHLVLSLVLLVSLLGFFGLFNPWLGFLAAHPDEGHDGHAHEQSTAAPATPPPAPQPPEPPQRPTAQARAQDVMGARHILVAYEGAMRARPQITRSKDEAKKRAEEVAAKAKKLGGPDERVDAWTKLVEEYSDEPGAAKRGGDLGRFRAGSFHKDFVAGTEKLKVGEISGAVETPFGYHVIWRTF